MVVLFVLSASIAVGLILLSSFIGRNKAPKERSLPYECGMDPIGEPRHSISINFFLIAALFIIFSIQIMFLFPIALLFRYAVAGGAGVFVMVELIIFLALMALALLYAWKMRALDL